MLPGLKLEDLKPSHYHPAQKAHRPGPKQSRERGKGPKALDESGFARALLRVAARWLQEWKESIGRQLREAERQEQARAPGGRGGAGARGGGPALLAAGGAADPGQAPSRARLLPRFPALPCAALRWRSSVNFAAKRSAESSQRRSAAEGSAVFPSWLCAGSADPHERP